MLQQEVDDVFRTIGRSFQPHGRAVAAMRQLAGTGVTITGTSVVESTYDEIMAKPTASERGTNN